MRSGVGVGRGVKVREGVRVGPKVGVCVAVPAGVTVRVRAAVPRVEGGGVKSTDKKIVSKTTFTNPIEKRMTRCRFSIGRIVVGREEDSK